ncbi:MAG: hypothetical protein V1736_06985 [Pseudomonadota bacterium]
MKDSYNVHRIATTLERKIAAMKKSEDNWDKKVDEVREQFCKAIRDLDRIIREDGRDLVTAGG